MKRFLLTTGLLLLTTVSQADLTTAEFTGKIVALGTCNKDNVNEYQIVKVRDASGVEITAYSYVGNLNAATLDGEFRSRYGTLLTAFQTDIEVTQRKQTREKYCRAAGLSVQLEFYTLRTL